MSINKSQRQALTVLEKSCFAHCQFYVRCLIVGSPHNLFIYDPAGKTKDIVYPEVLTRVFRISKAMMGTDLISYKTVAIHCAHGKGRTGTMIACYLIKYHNQTASEALRNIRESRPGSVETFQQEELIYMFENQNNQTKTQKET